MHSLTHFTTTFYYFKLFLILNLWIYIHLLLFCKLESIEGTLYKQIVKKVSTLTEWGRQSAYCEEPVITYLMPRTDGWQSRDCELLKSRKNRSAFQTKTKMRYQLTPVSLSIIKNIHNKCCWGCRQKGTLVHCWWESKLVQSLWKMVSRLLKKL